MSNRTPDINNTNINTNLPSKGLITDNLELYNGKEIWTYARNVSANTRSGDIISLSNESSTILCADIPYTYIGNIPLIENRFAIFSTDNTNSEIGIFEADTCTYSILVSGDCLAFNTEYLVSGKAKVNWDGSETIYWTDSLNNPMRYLKLNKIPYVEIGTSGCTTLYSGDLDCERLKLYQDISVPTLTAELTTNGNLKNGTYQFGIAYSVKKDRLTDVYSITDPISVFSHQNKVPKGISLTISNLSTEFEEYQLFVTYTINNVTTYKSMGYYGINQTVLNISQIDRPEYEDVELLTLITAKPYYNKAKWCSGNDKYLIFSGLESEVEIGYQAQAMSIESNYAIIEAPANYYGTYGGINVGYYSDEAYAFGIQWLKINGQWTDVYHIPGTTSGSTHVADNLDIYETDDTVCFPDGVPPGWYVDNTSSPIERDIYGPVECDLTFMTKGNMAYTESTLLYLDNKEMFPNDYCTPIRHHKFPSEANEPRYTYDPVIQGANYTGTIRIKAIQFSNIEHPKDGDGNYLPGIVGYRIVRSDRDGNRTVIAKGYSTNMRYYDDEASNRIMYPNYPYNFLGTDNFHTRKQGIFDPSASGPSDYIINADDGDVVDYLTGYYEGRFTFYSPHTLFSQVSLPTEVIFETDEAGDVAGKFTYPYRMPRYKLWSDNGINRTLAFAGAAGMTAALSFSSLGAYLATITEKASNAASNYMTLVSNTIDWQNYILQYQSYYLFSKNWRRRTAAMGRRRFVQFSQYLADGINTYQYEPGTYINNFKKPIGVALQLNSNISAPTPTSTSFVDDSLQVYSHWTTPPEIDKWFISTQASYYYTALKRRLPDQYGTLTSINYVNTGYYQDISSLSGSTQVYSTGVVFGGDCFINRLTVNQPQPFFTANPIGLADGSLWDFRNHSSLAHPTFWLNSAPYTIFDKLQQWVNGITAILTPSAIPAATDGISSRYVLDNYIDVKNQTKDIIRAGSGNAAYMYHSYNGIMQLFVESDYNIDYRDYTLAGSNIWSVNGDVDWIFRADHMESTSPYALEEFIYDKTYSKQNTEITAVQQRLDFELALSESFLSKYPNRVIYSLPANTQFKTDNWLHFLPLNYYDFPKNQFGNLTSIHAIDNQQLLFLFDKSAPYVTIGRDQLQTQNNIKITIGDGGLFDRDPRPLYYSDYAYGSSISRYAFKASHLGMFYVSQNQGKIFQGKEDVAENGNSYWLANNFPSKLVAAFPNYPLYDNPSVGVGVVSGFDFISQTLYVTKRDYSPIVEGITLSGSTFYYDGDPISLTDSQYFEDASFTVSYNVPGKFFVSWHDYHPLSFFNTTNSLFSVSPDSKIYIHNESDSSFCNFYGVNYPHGFELPVNLGQNVSLLNTVEYQMVAQKYEPINANVIPYLDETYNLAIIRNHEQISGYLNLELKPRNTIASILQRSTYNSLTGQFDIPLHKYEQKFRFNDFFDITKDAGEYSNSPTNLMSFDSSGYKFTINPLAVDPYKPLTQRKRLRDKNFRVYFERTISNDIKTIFHLSNFKTSASPR